VKFEPSAGETAEVKPVKFGERPGGMRGESHEPSSQRRAKPEACA